MFKTIRKDSISLITSILLLIVSFGITLFSNYTLNYKHYAASALIGVSLVLYFKNKKLFIYLFGLTLILGVLNVIDVFYINTLFGIGKIQLNLIVLILLIVFFIFNKEIISEILVDKKIDESKNLIKHYEQKFKSKTASELKSIADDKSAYSSEAKEASKIILKKKYSKQ